MSTARSKLITYLLLGLFIIPMFAAGTMYFTGKGIPHHTVNHGTLISPPLDFNQLNLINPPAANGHPAKRPGKWLLLYINPGPCSQQCLDILYKIRQTHTALGKDSDRVIRVMLTTQHLTPALLQQLNQTYHGTLPFTITQAQLTRFLGDSPAKAEALSYGRLYLVDPLGNTMLTYPLNTAFKPLHSDLKRLLQLSQIG